MDLSKTSQYALRVLGFMALNEDGLYTAEQLFNELKIPRQYLRRLLTNLSKKGLLKSDKGKGGGFRFSGSISTIYLSDILEVTEKKELLNSCIFGFENCIRDNKCAMHDRWSEAKENMLNILQTTSLATLVMPPANNTKNDIPIQ